MNDEITIIGIDKSKALKPDEQYSLYHVYVELSQTPDADWEALFIKERGFPRHSMWRDAWIEGPYIVVHCVPSEMSTHHARDVAEDVASVNAKYRAMQHSRQIREKAAAERDAAERRRVDDDLDKVKF